MFKKCFFVQPVMAIILFFLTLLLFGCTKKVESIQFLNKAPDIHIGEIVPLEIAIFPDDADDQEVIFTSSNEAVAKVVEHNLYALSEGKVLITVQQNSKDFDAWYVDVKYVFPDKIVFKEQINTLGIGRTAKIPVDFYPEYTTDKTVIYESSDTGILQIHGNILTAVSEGKATITARHPSGISTQMSVIVTPVIPDSLDISGDTTQEINSVASLSVAYSPSDVTDKDVFWETSDSSILSIDNGLITAHKIGVVTITATHKSGLQVQKDIEVVPIQASSVSITSEANKDVYIDESIKLTAEISPNDVTEKGLTWSSNKPEIATVKNGTVKGIYPGTATITVTTSNGKSDSINITVDAPPVKNPSDGYSYNYTKKERVAPFKVTVPAGDEYYFIKLKDYNSGKTVITFFLYPGSSKEINVPSGRYRMYYASGTTWCGTEYLFGRETAYHSADTIFGFSIEGQYYNGHEVKLIKQIGGNLYTSVSNENEFAD